MFLVRAFEITASNSAYLVGMNGGPSADQSERVIFLSSGFSKKEFICICSEAFKVAISTPRCSLSKGVNFLTTASPRPHTKGPRTFSSPLHLACNLVLKSPTAKCKHFLCGQEEYQCNG